MALQAGITLQPVAVLKRLQTKLQTFPMAVQRLVASETAEVLERARVWMIANKLTGGTTSSRLKVRSGSLVKSWRVRVTQSKTGVEGVLEQDGRYRARLYAATHEFGAVITPKRAKLLTIPLNEAARRRPARQWKSLFWIRSKRGTPLLVRRTPGGGIEPMFVGRTSVTIPARPFLRPTAEKFFPLIVQRLATKVPEQFFKDGAA